MQPREDRSPSPKSPSPVDEERLSIRSSRAASEEPTRFDEMSDAAKSGRMDQRTQEGYNSRQGSVARSDSQRSSLARDGERGAGTQLTPSRMTVGEIPAPGSTRLARQTSPDVRVVPSAAYDEHLASIRSSRAQSEVPERPHDDEPSLSRSARQVSRSMDHGIAGVRSSLQLNGRDDAEDGAEQDGVVSCSEATSRASSTCPPVVNSRAASERTHGNDSLAGSFSSVSSALGIAARTRGGDVAGGGSGGARQTRAENRTAASDALQTGGARHADKFGRQRKVREGKHGAAGLGGSTRDASQLVHHHTNAVLQRAYYTAHANDYVAKVVAQVYAVPGADAVEWNAPQLDVPDQEEIGHRRRDVLVGHENDRASYIGGVDVGGMRAPQSAALRDPSGLEGRLGAGDSRHIHWDTNNIRSAKRAGDALSSEGLSKEGFGDDVSSGHSSQTGSGAQDKSERRAKATRGSFFVLEQQVHHPVSAFRETPSPAQKGLSKSYEPGPLMMNGIETPEAPWSSDSPEAVISECSPSCIGEGRFATDMADKDVVMSCDRFDTDAQDTGNSDVVSNPNVVVDVEVHGREEGEGEGGESACVTRTRTSSSPPIALGHTVSHGRASVETSATPSSLGTMDGSTVSTGRNVSPLVAAPQSASPERTQQDVTHRKKVVESSNISGAEGVSADNEEESQGGTIDVDEDADGGRDERAPAVRVGVGIRDDDDAAEEDENLVRNDVGSASGREYSEGVLIAEGAQLTASMSSAQVVDGDDRPRTVSALAMRMIPDYITGQPTLGLCVGDSTGRIDYFEMPTGTRGASLASSALNGTRKRTSGFRGDSATLKSGSGAALHAKRSNTRDTSMCTSFGTSMGDVPYDSNRRLQLQHTHRAYLRELDCLKSVSVDEGVKCIKFLPAHRSPGIVSYLSANESVIKLFHIRKEHFDAQAVFPLLQQCPDSWTAQSSCVRDYRPQSQSKSASVASRSVPGAAAAAAAAAGLDRTGSAARSRSALWEHMGVQPHLRSPTRRKSSVDLRGNPTPTLSSSVLTTFPRAYKPLIIPVKAFMGPHTSAIQGLSVCADGETFLSVDDLQVFWWNLNAADTTKATCIADLRPPSRNMEEVEELVTAAMFHPTHGSLFLLARSSGILNVGDLRDPPSREPRRYAITTAVQADDMNCVSEQYNDILCSISDASYLGDNYIVTRDYISMKLWDLRNMQTPADSTPVMQYVAPYLSALYNNDAIFDRFPIVVDDVSGTVASGLYDSAVAVWQPLRGRSSSCTSLFGESTTELSNSTSGVYNNSSKVASSGEGNLEYYKAIPQDASSAWKPANRRAQASQQFQCERVYLDEMKENWSAAWIACDAAGGSAEEWSSGYGQQQTNWDGAQDQGEECGFLESEDTRRILMNKVQSIAMAPGGERFAFTSNEGTQIYIFHRQDSQEDL